MSPDQLAGGEHVDGRTDVYSLGCVLYEMLAGEPPFTGPTAQPIQARKLTDPVRRLRTIRETVPDALDQVIRRALAKNPADRFATAHQLAEALKRGRTQDAAAGAESPVAREGPTPRRRSARTAAVVATAVVLAAASWWAFNASRGRRAGVAGPTRVESLAVLPLDNFTGDPGQEYFVDGMTEALIADLSKIGALRVISRRSVMQYKAVSKPLPEIAKELHVGFVVEGSVVQAGGRVRITAQLIEGATDRHLWAERYERDLRDVLALQSEVARAIAHEVRIKLTPQEQARLETARPIDPAAHEAYLLGRYLWNKRTAAGLAKAFTYFRQAINKDSSYAAAYAGMADYYNVLPFYSRHSPVEVFPQAKAAALKALEIDEGLSEAHAALAYITAYYDWDLHGAEREFQRALELNPSNAAAHHSYSRLLAATGRVDEALAEIKRSEALDPVSPLLQANTAKILYFGGRYDQAIEQLHRTLELAGLSQNGSQARHPPLRPEIPSAHAPSGAAGVRRPSPPDELLHDPGRAVRRAQRREDGARVHRDRPCPVVRIDEVPRQGLDVAVEDQPHELELPIQQGRPRVAPDDVVRRDEIERRRQVEPGRWALPAGRQAPRRLPARRRVAVVHAVEGREGHRPRAVVRVAAHHAVGEPQRERGVGWERLAVHVEPDPCEPRGEVVGARRQARRFLAQRYHHPAGPAREQERGVARGREVALEQGGHARRVA